MTIKIAKERPQSEYEIQREAHSLLTEALGVAYIVRGEYAYGGCIFDLAIFNAETRDLVCTVEIKRKKYNRKARTVAQTNKYHRRTGKPCILLTDKTMRGAIAYLKNNLDKRGGRLR